MEGEMPVPELQVQLAICGGEFLELDLIAMYRLVFTSTAPLDLTFT